MLRMTTVMVLHLHDIPLCTRVKLTVIQLLGHADGVVSINCVKPQKAESIRYTLHSVPQMY